MQVCFLSPPSGRLLGWVVKCSILFQSRRSAALALRLPYQQLGWGLAAAHMIRQRGQALGLGVSYWGAGSSSWWCCAARAAAAAAAESVIRPPNRLLHCRCLYNAICLLMLQMLLNGLAPSTAMMMLCPVCCACFRCDSGCVQHAFLVHEACTVLLLYACCVPTACLRPGQQRLITGSGSAYYHLPVVVSPLGRACSAFCLWVLAVRCAHRCFCRVSKDRPGLNCVRACYASFGGSLCVIELALTGPGGSTVGGGSAGSICPSRLAQACWPMTSVLMCLLL
jgi:hypothetical protein